MGDLLIIFLPLSQPNSTVTAVIIRYTISASDQAHRNGSSNTCALSRYVANMDSTIPLREARLPKKKYSRVLMRLTVLLLAPKVRNNILSLMRWYLLMIKELISTSMPVKILNIAINWITKLILLSKSSKVSTTMAKFTMEMFGY